MTSSHEEAGVRRTTERAGGPVWLASIVARLPDHDGIVPLAHLAIGFGATSLVDAETYAEARALVLYPDALDRSVAVTKAPGLRWESVDESP